MTGDGGQWSQTQHQMKAVLYADPYFLSQTVQQCGSQLSLFHLPFCNLEMEQHDTIEHHMEVM